MTDTVDTKFQRVVPATILARDAGPFERLFGQAGKRIRAGRLSLITPSGARFVFRGTNPGPSARIIIHRWRALADMALNASVGLGRSYARGDWDSPDIPSLISFLSFNVKNGATPTMLARVSRRVRNLAFRLRPNTLSGSPRKISFHYDVGNDFYGAWLDQSRTYSSAFFEHPEMTLAEAQVAKYRRIADGLSLAPGDHVLEIGCGWGGFAIFAAQEYGARVTGITLSQEQFSLATARVRDAGLAGQVDFKLCDYRQVDGQYSHIVSIEMLEAVGEPYWPVYFDTLNRCLAPGGRIAIQCIVIDPVAFPSYRRGADFIQSCVFPGGMLPTAEIIAGQAQRMGLSMRDNVMLGPHYAQTLNIWRQNLIMAMPDLSEMGFDKFFCRMWSFYLAYCEGGFRAGRVDAGQWFFEKAASGLSAKGSRG